MLMQDLYLEVNGKRQILGKKNYSQLKNILTDILAQNTGGILTQKSLLFA
jgi:hypothetical protein